MNYTICSKISLLFVFIVSFQFANCQKKSSYNLVLLHSVKKILTASTDQSFSVLKDTGSFLINNSLEEALPDELKQINSKLESLGLTGLVEKEKQNIGKAAQEVVPLIKPIINSAIKEIKPLDAAKILAGGKGAATQYLKKKTEAKLIAAIQPKVENEMNSSGISTLINTALNDQRLQNAIALLTGNNSSANTYTSKSIGEYATRQIVNGFFKVAEDYEIKNSDLTQDRIKSLVK